MLQNNRDEEEEGIFGSDANSDISDADDRDYVLDSQANKDEDGHRIQRSHLMSPQSQSNRLSKRGSYWSEHPLHIAEHEATTS